jgi:hypothetical protein
MFDFEKFFDSIDRMLLWRLAAHYQFPLGILRLSLRSYSWTRSLVSQDNLASRRLHPLRGVGPGSALAIYECKLYALQLLQAIRAFPVTVSLHVDDLSIYIEETSPSKVAEVAQPVLSVMEAELAKAHLRISAKKEGLTATDELTFRAVAEQLAAAQDIPRAIPHRISDTPAKLGIDYSFGRRRIPAKGHPTRRKCGQLGVHGAMTVRAARRQKMLARLSRAAAICGRHGFGQIFRCGILPGIAYAAELTPVSSKELAELDRACKKAFRWNVPFVADDLLWGLVGPGGRPSFAHRMTAIERYARAAWAVTEVPLASQLGFQPSTTTVLDMHTLVHFARVIQGRSAAEGTVGHILQEALDYFHLQLEGPLFLDSTSGPPVRINMAVTSPALVKHQLTLRADFMAEQAAGRALVGPQLDPALRLVLAPAGMV